MDILNEKIEGLVKKAEKSGMPYGILKKVYDRGMAAWKTGHRPGTTPQQWAFARVNSFVTKSSGTWGKADKDLADKVRGAKKEEIENPKNAKDILGQIREKLPKDADAGDYVKDFRKSKAPQFKGKSDKKIQKMAIAAYLDSKEEVKEENCPKCDNDPCKCENIQEQIKTFNRNALTPSDKSKLAKHFDKLANDRTTTGNEKPYYQTLSRYVMGNVKPFDFNDMIGGAPEQVLGTIGRATASIIGKGKAKTFIPGFKEENIQESGHTDVASMKTQVQIAMDALQKMQMNLGKLTDEDDLPTWWTNKVATAVNKLDGMADYIDAMHDRGKEMSEQVNLEEDICDGNIRLSEGRMKELHGYIQRGMSAQAIAKKMKLDVKTIEALMKEDLDEVELDEAVLAGRDYKYDGKGPIKISKKMYAKVKKDSKSMIKGKPYMMALNPKTQGTELVPVVFEEVDNSLAAQATRVISQTAIREKKDPADIDFTATDLDRKAADKNIFVQLKRAQDMKGKGDIEFLDKKKKKVDIRIINKAIDMMMKMKPADRAKMQTAIGKSYRDLLKTVQRGKV